MKKKLLIITLPFLGIAILMFGFFYDVTFAGIPYQDPTPALQARYDFHSNVARWFYKIGVFVFLMGLIAIPLILKFSKGSSAVDDARTRRWVPGAGFRANRYFTDSFLESFWEGSDYERKEYISEKPDLELIQQVEEELGYKLPESYIELMMNQNGGIPANSCFRCNQRTSWAENHIAISGILGIGYDKEYSLCGGLGSQFMMEEWGYPNIGVYFGDCPSAGHDMICLDYRDCGSRGEPKVIHVDQEVGYIITPLADSFEEFVKGLVNESEFDY